MEEHQGSAVVNHLREQHDLERDDIAQSFRILNRVIFDLQQSSTA